MFGMGLTNDWFVRDFYRDALKALIYDDESMIRSRYLETSESMSFDLFSMKQIGINV